MNKTALEEIGAEVSRFLHKASKKNEPLEAFRETTEYKKLESAFEDGIKEQVAKAAGNLPAWTLDDTLTDKQFEDRMNDWLLDNVPAISKYVDQNMVVDVFIESFNFSVQSAYSRIGVVAKATTVNFELTNPQYIEALEDQANYLLTKSTIDETTRNRMFTLIRDSRLGMDTLDELASMIEAEFEGISATRAFMIANTEANQAMSSAQQAFLKENGFKTKLWIPAGPNTCSICQGNADDGAIPLDNDFSSGEPHPPAHPGCECYEDAGDEIDLDTISLWDGGGGNAEKGALSMQVDVKLKGLEEFERKLIKRHETTEARVDGKIATIEGTIRQKVESIREEIKRQNKLSNDELADDLKKNIKPTNTTVIQKADIPSELLEVLDLMSQVLSQPAPQTPINLSDYKPHDEEEGATDYYGFLHTSGAWYIVEGQDDQQRYAAGSSGYKEAWSKRESLKYKYIDEAFA